MREIKFRVWDKKKKRMGTALNLVLTDDGIFGGSVDFDGEMSVDVFGEDYEYLQYTGLKDRDEKEIYEGDIVDCHRDDGVRSYKVRVKICDIQSLPRELGGSNLDYRVIIGNIYENSDEVV